jgi:hypothetical protein
MLGFTALNPTCASSDSPIHRLTDSPNLEQSDGLAGFDIHIHPSKGRVGAGAGHQADGPRARADVFGAAGVSTVHLTRLFKSDSI